MLDATVRFFGYGMRFQSLLWLFGLGSASSSSSLCRLVVKSPSRVLVRRRVHPFGAGSPPVSASVLFLCAGRVALVSASRPTTF